MTDIGEIPVAGYLSDSDREFLRSVDFDGRLLFELPVDGPFTPEQVLAIANVGSLREKIDVIHSLPVDGPFSPEEITELVTGGSLQDVADAVHSLGVEGPVTTKQLLDVARRLDEASSR